jgi:hypothetical protein
MSKKPDSVSLQRSIIYAEALIRHDCWIEKAEELLAAARLLEEKLLRFWAAVSPNKEVPAELAGLGSLQAPYFMLIAYAIENYCKAFLVRENEPQLRSRTFTKLPDYLNDHDLARLAGRLGLPLDVPEEELLARLTRCSLWAGRYPVPASPNGMRNVEEFSNGRKYLLAYFSAPDLKRIHDFIERLRRHVSLAGRDDSQTAG